MAETSELCGRNMNCVSPHYDKLTHTHPGVKMCKVQNCTQVLRLERETELWMCEKSKVMLHMFHSKSG